ncbi:uncharacterized protein BHQ10_009811 [Talaromyces amestolkiae]|uniref:protein-tyrosine-phosphatase n=1 Tax=Talaromyces amestolkiae TaxID=1196081 RepID=A0A364LDF0_TALAM|nr:uncharacterized protein BHQ10_009811 [Talaromyces amestolkiae]RAO73799.1 hypothetical protein BHQ10_009811 [Talaromyces amestolkiae]
MQSSPTTRQSPASSPWAADRHSRQLGGFFNSSNTHPIQHSAFNGTMPSPFLFPRDSSDGGGSGGSAPTRIQPRATHEDELGYVVTIIFINAQPKATESIAKSSANAYDKFGGFLEPHNSNMDIDVHASPMQISPMENQRGQLNQIPSFGFPNTYSPDIYQPTPGSNARSDGDRREHPSLSFPGTTSSPLPSSGEDRRRAETLPTPTDQLPINFISVDDCQRLLQAAPETTLLLDIRPYPQFSQANIMESLNLCIPTTLLKRPSFNTEKLKDTFTNESEQRKFLSWRQSDYIIVYDSNTVQLRDATLLMNVLKKFKVEGWHGEGRILRGGFAAFASRFPNQVRQQRQNNAKPSGMGARPMSLNLASTVPVAGGCSLPDAGPAEPFFSNIRQNMDLVGGVGQMPVKLPNALTPEHTKNLPQWLRKASSHEDKGHDVSQKFLNIEQRELRRMREALNSHVNYDEQSSTKFRVAGIEKGSKNRYNDIYPFDHSRVRLQDVPSGACDYINANHVGAKFTNKTYIATQAPIPDTFVDFWRVIWEHDVRVIVALTAEMERGQIKCHPYWNTNSYGPFKVKSLGERRVYVDLPQDPETPQRPSASEKKPSSEGLFTSGDERPYILVRHFTLSHSDYPFKPIREITQLQYSYWPDFGTTSQPNHLLQLVEQCNKITRRSSSINFSAEDAEPPGLRPIVVHCSAGCGRTGTFCTVDSVLDMLKQQRTKRATNDDSRKKNNDDNEKWIYDDSTDLVAKTVEDFRTQRPSMVQNLSQFVLCYETILEWAALHDS